jgi:hypothetical protein
MWAVRWLIVRERDILGREVVLGRQGVFLFRLRGHIWTEIVLEPRPTIGRRQPR